MKNTAPSLILLSFGFAINLHAQFTQVEFFKSLDKTTFNLFSSQYLNDGKSLNLTTLGFFENYGSQENRNFNESGIQPTLFWNFSKRISIGPSLYYNSIGGFSQRISARYTSKSERLLLVLIPTIGYAQQEEQIYAEAFAQFQFKVPVKEFMSFWINGQFLTVWDEFKVHSRSFQQLRAGISLKGHQFGLGLDMDRYGPQAHSKKAIGMYYRRML
ncbi:MAG: hypothetical protein HRU41_35880 [Saprospiraceae bacterium]|nr:hypothetical protein [Saprospiraceae bacterium]